MNGGAARLSIGVAAALLLGSAILAKSDDIPPCVPPLGVVVVSRDQAPPALTQALTAQLGEIAAPGEKFDATDVVRTGRNRRLIFIWGAGTKWIVATEHGGRGYNDPIFVYLLSDDKRNAVRVAEKISFPNSVCADAHELIALR